MENLVDIDDFDPEGILHIFSRTVLKMISHMDEEWLGGNAARRDC